MKNNFIFDTPYFQLVFLDHRCSYPIINTLIYLGKNIEENVGKDLWFFQDLESYYRIGRYDGLEENIPQCQPNNRGMGAQVFDFPQAQLQNIYTVKELVTELKLF